METPETEQDKINRIFTENDKVIEYVNSISANIASVHTEALDNVMKSIHTNIIMNPNFDDKTLENAFIELSSTVYFVGEALQAISISNDVADAKSKETYNMEYLNAAGQKDERGKSVRTVDENKAIATESSKYEALVATIQQRAYELAKYKVNAAQSMIGTLSKLLSKKMSDASLTLTTNRGITE